MKQARAVPSDEYRDEEAATDDALVEADDLIEEISIDGMCGVY